MCNRELPYQLTTFKSHSEEKGTGIFPFVMAKVQDNWSVGVCDRFIIPDAEVIEKDNLFRLSSQKNKKEKTFHSAGTIPPIDSPCPLNC